jgi:hypothetical protein
MVRIYRIFLFCLVLFLFSISLFAQEQNKHEKRIYQGKDGKLFIQKSLPVYFRISFSPNESGASFLLNPETFDKPVVPVYFKNEGLNILYHPYAVDTVTKQIVQPEKPVPFQIYVDGTPPVTTASFTTVASSVKGENRFYGKNTEIVITAKDEVSGVEHIYYSIDKGNFTEYIAPLKFDAEKSYEIRFYSVDNVGNVEKVGIRTFSIDMTSPISTIKFEGDVYENVISGRSKIILSTSEKVTGIVRTVYQLDDQSEVQYIGPIYSANISEGEHTLNYYSIDKLSNKETTKQVTFFVDKTPPIIIEDVLGDSYMANGKEYSSGRTKLKLTSIDNRAGVKSVYYSINGGEFQLYDKPFYLSNQKGNLSIKSYAIDNVNNKSTGGSEGTRAKSYQSIVDLVGPDLSYDFNGPTFKYHDTTYVSNTTKIILKALDYESGFNKIVYSLDKLNDSTYKIPFNVSGNGLHKVDFTGYDNVNNSNQSTFFFKVDEIGPEIFYLFSSPPYKEKINGNSKLLIYPEQSMLFLSATDNGVGLDKIFYSIDNEPERLYYNYFQGFRKGKSYNLKIRAIDKLGNQSVKEINFAIE